MIDSLKGFWPSWPHFLGPVVVCHGGSTWQTQHSCALLTARKRKREGSGFWKLLQGHAHGMVPFSLDLSLSFCIFPFGPPWKQCFIEDTPEPIHVRHLQLLHSLQGSNVFCGLIFNLPLNWVLAQKLSCCIPETGLSYINWIIGNHSPNGKYGIGEVVLETTI